MRLQRRRESRAFGRRDFLNGICDVVILEAQNCVSTDNDITCHAELNLVKKIGSHFALDDLKETVIYASTEPCVMCLGALYWAGIRRIVYGVSAKDLACLVGESFVWPTRELVSRADESFEIVGPVLPERGLKQHQSYWV